MRLFGAQRNSDCGPIAIYNLARILRLPSAAGGYEANRPRLSRATGHTRRDGCGSEHLWAAALAELEGSPYTLRVRRNSWSNVARRLIAADFPSTIALVSYMTLNKDDELQAHIAVLWRPYDRPVILGSGLMKEHAIAPLWVYEGKGLWPTAVCPELNAKSRVFAFWQLTPRKPTPPNP